MHTRARAKAPARDPKSIDEKSDRCSIGNIWLDLWSIRFFFWISPRDRHRTIRNHSQALQDASRSKILTIFFSSVLVYSSQFFPVLIVVFPPRSSALKLIFSIIFSPKSKIDLQNAFLEWQICRFQVFFLSFLFSQSEIKMCGFCWITLQVQICEYTRFNSIECVYVFAYFFFLSFFRPIDVLLASFWHNFLWQFPCDDIVSSHTAEYAHTHLHTYTTNKQNSPNSPSWAA